MGVMGCSCNDVFCALGCVAGKTLDNVSSQVKSCAGSCASGMQQEFDKFKLRYGRVYESAEEEAKRFAIFQDSLAKAVELNAFRIPTMVMHLVSHDSWT